MNSINWDKFQQWCDLAQGDGLAEEFLGLIYSLASAGEMVGIERHLSPEDSVDVETAVAVYQYIVRG